MTERSHFEGKAFQMQFSQAQNPLFGTCHFFRWNCYRSQQTEQITDWPTPKSVQEVQQLASYYRRFIQNFAGIAKLLHHLIEQEEFKWTVKCENAFAKLKLHLRSNPILSFPDLSLPFILDTDAYQCGIGAVLSQIHKDGTERVVGFASRAMSKSE